MRFSQLKTQRLAIWGWGREGQAVYAALRAWEKRHPCSQRPSLLPLTLFCSPQDVILPQVEMDRALDICRQVTVEKLCHFDLVVKSPGISPYHPPAAAASQAGVRFISGTQLWLAEHANTHACLPQSVCVTGTKGKSTTTALIAHLLRSEGYRTALAGNIGLPLLDLAQTQPPADFWAIELSSYQTRDVAASGVRPQVALVLNVFPEHLDWHGDWSTYVRDKLSLVTQAQPNYAVLNAADPTLQSLKDLPSQIVWFNHRAGWHVEDQTLKYQNTSILAADAFPLPGQHNLENLAAALAAVAALGLDARHLARHATSFQALPHRLQMLGWRDGLRWVNDSISTTPKASLAALACFSHQPVVLLLGGYDRGIDWTPYAPQFRHNGPLAVVAFGANRERIVTALSPYAAGRFRLQSTAQLAEAVRLARALAVSSPAVILLSPGAPSFDGYANYIERGNHFAALAGFALQDMAGVPNLGIK